MITTKTMIRFTSWICLVCTPLKLFCWYNGFKFILMEHSYSCPCELTRFFNEIFVQWCVFDKTYHPEPSNIPYSPYQVLNKDCFCHFIQQSGSSKCLFWNLFHCIIVFFILNLALMVQSVLSFVCNFCMYKNLKKSRENSRAY